jgi:hypothetical protein
MNVQFNWGLGAIFAIIALILVIVFAAIGKMAFLLAGILALLALSRLC